MIEEETGDFVTMNAMQVTVDIPDDVVARIEAEGVAVTRFAQLAVNDKLPKEPKHETPKERMARMEGFFREMAMFSDRIPELPDYAYTRESFYEDHD